MNQARGSALVLCCVTLLACGQSREEKRVAHLKEQCKGAVGGSIRDLELAYDGLPINIAPPCSSDASQFPPSTCTAGQSLCLLGFDFVASSDQNVCTSSGCYFTCLVVAAQADLEGHEAASDHSTPICGTEWVNGLSNPPFYTEPYWVPGIIYQ